ncbi:hypothetical protein NBT05_11855 [Aquimarina sp. ERC-38]|uniref:hypothetical protein n=1 Tax=Aquimarina sp. ERC-38 TaxID=2949996 RepID=UPI002245171A|nr:hypothetical protein [Aquimarina sp. ERC-38]UZO79645.1 hypothetical protein NBT05_11855 [Aquimarina sp. ERC-38]
MKSKSFDPTKNRIVEKYLYKVQSKDFKNLENKAFIKHSTVKEDIPHLKDTIKVSGNTILILRPDSLRFQYYVNIEEPGIYEVDSDFGFGVSEALDSFELDSIKKSITERRYVQIFNCNKCPVIIDRDSIDYGILLTRNDRDVKIDQNIFGKEYYLDKFKKYFSN